MGGECQVDVLGRVMGGEQEEGKKDFRRPSRGSCWRVTGGGDRLGLGLDWIRNVGLGVETARHEMREDEGSQSGQDNAVQFDNSRDILFQAEEGEHLISYHIRFIS